MFTGLGTLLIEGDALLNYLKRSESSVEKADQDLSDAILDFVNKFNKAGFDKIKIIFFEKISYWIEKSSSDEMDLKSEIKSILDRLNLDYVLFKDWSKNDVFNQFFVNERISLFITSDLDIYKQEDIQFTLIHEMSAKIQVCIMTNLKFQNLYVQCFLVLANSEYSFLKDEKNLNNKSTILKENVVDLDEKLEQDMKLCSQNRGLKFQLYALQNPEVKEILDLPTTDLNKNELEAKKEEIFLSSQDNFFNYSDRTFEINLVMKFDREKFAYETTLKQNQKYYRYMERYSTSLDACKHLHHQILITKDQQASEKKNAAMTKEKLSSKALKIIEEKDRQKSKEKDAADMIFFQTFHKGIYSVQDLNDAIRFLNLDKYGKKFHFKLLLLKLKVYKNDKPFGMSQEERYAELFLIVKELVEDFSDMPEFWTEKLVNNFF
jgi:hypothetical protein